MTIRQISVFLENKKGRLAEVTNILTSQKINIRALSLADTTDFGVLRIIVNDPAHCLEVLKSAGFIAQQTDVLAVEMADRPGGLHSILSLFDEKGINIEYMYAFVEKKSEDAIVIFKVNDTAAAMDALQKAGVSILTQKIIEQL